MDQSVTQLQVDETTLPSLKYTGFNDINIAACVVEGIRGSISYTIKLALSTTASTVLGKIARDEFNSMDS